MEKKKKRLAAPLPRKLHIDGKVWTYKPGTCNSWSKTVVLNPERTKKWLVPIQDLHPDYDEDWYEEDYLKGDYDDDSEVAFAKKFAITPSLVKEHIIKNIIGGKAHAVKPTNK